MKATPTIASGGNDGSPPIDLLERVIRIESALPNFATKTDLAELRTEMHQEFSKIHQEIAKLHQEMGKMSLLMVNQTWRFIGFTTSYSTALVAAVYFIAQHVGK